MYRTITPKVTDALLQDIMDCVCTIPAASRYWVAENLADQARRDQPALWRMLDGLEAATGEAEDAEHGDDDAAPVMTTAHHAAISELCMMVGRTLVAQYLHQNV